MEISNIRFYNNTFKTDGDAVLIRGEDNPEVIFEGNVCLIDDEDFDKEKK